MFDAPERSSPSAGLPERKRGLRDIFPNATFQRCGDIPLGPCSVHWSDCRRGDLFLAIETEDNDGHDDVNRAIARGARAIVTERLLPVTVPQCVVADSRIAWGEICHALAGDPSRSLDTILLAGSDGKSTTAHLLNSILGEGQAHTSPNEPRCANRDDISGRSNKACWTPARLSLWLADRASSGCRTAVVEAQESDLTNRALEGCRFNTAILTNIRTRIKQRQRGFMKAVDHLAPGGTLVLNADDPVTGSILDSIDVPVVTTGIREDANVVGKLLESSSIGQILSITAGDESVIIESVVPGAGYAYNLLLAVAAGWVHGIPLATIAKRIRGSKNLAGRMQVIEGSQPFTVLVDQADTPWRLAATLNMLKHHVRGRIIAVFSAPENANATVAAEFGRVAEKGSNLPVITRAQVGLSVDFERCHQVLDGFRRTVRAQSIPDRIAAIEWALSQAREGDAVLIAGSGDRSICGLADNRWQLCDAEVCQAWLWENARQPDPVAKPSFVSPRIYHIEDYRDEGHF